MRHQRQRFKLGVKTHHRKALLRNLVKSLVVRKRITTTLAKAKAASSFADQVVQIAKQGDLSARRLLISRLGCPDTARTLIRDIAPQFQSRQGGYTRVLRLDKNRMGDNAQLALLEFTAVIEAPAKSRKPKKEKKAKPAKHEEQTHAPSEKKREKEHEHKKEIKKEKETPTQEAKLLKEKKESEKKGGFLGALRKFLKGDDK